MNPASSDVSTHTSIELGRVSTNPSSPQPSSTTTMSISNASADRSAKYKLLEQVGNGSFGVVYKAVNKDTGEVVAIKEVSR